MIASSAAAAVSPWFLTGQIAGDAPAQSVPIAGLPFSVGRSMKNSLTLADPTVSGRHAELLEGNGGLIVKDLESTNGTFLNGRRLEGSARVGDGDMLQFGNLVLKLSKREQYAENVTIAKDCEDEALALVLFERLLKGKSVTPHFQPIVDMASRRTVGYEVLARSRLMGLMQPGEMFKAAARHSAEAALSRLMRVEGARAGEHLPADAVLYFNTHPKETNHDELMDSLKLLRVHYPARPLMLEVHEAAITSVAYLRQLRAELSAMNIGLAFDDFGAGQARLLELAVVGPDVLKFDIDLIRNLDRTGEQRRRMIDALVRMVVDLGITPLAEGVEREEEAEACLKMGFTLAQGYYYGRPAPAETWLASPTATPSSGGDSTLKAILPQPMIPANFIEISPLSTS